jgi:hypothetical protein
MSETGFWVGFGVGIVLMIVAQIKLYPHVGFLTAWAANMGVLVACEFLFTLIFALIGIK